MKRKGTQGRHSIYHKLWNEHHPDNQIVPGDGCVIHHIDENPNNNVPKNLLKMTDREHKKHHTTGGRHHNQGKKYSPELRKKLSDAHKGQVAWNKGKKDYLSEESRYKIGAARRGKPSACGMLGKKHSEETKEKMRGRMPWNKGIPMSDESKQKLRETIKGKIPWNKGIKQTDYDKTKST